MAKKRRNLQNVSHNFTSKQLSASLKSIKNTITSPNTHNTTLNITDECASPVAGTQVPVIVPLDLGELTGTNDDEGWKVVTSARKPEGVKPVPAPPKPRLKNTMEDVETEVTY
ncbi:hypothetical protein vseg_003562 [Gypsophila vaccaria]